MSDHGAGGGAAGGRVSAGDLALVRMLARGYTTSQAAREMHLSPYTVAERIGALLERFDCKNRTELVAFCYVHGLLSTRAWPPDERSSGQREILPP